MCGCSICPRVHHTAASLQHTYCPWWSACDGLQLIPLQSDRPYAPHWSPKCSSLLSTMYIQMKCSDRDNITNFDCTKQGVGCCLYTPSRHPKRSSSSSMMSTQMGAPSQPRRQYCTTKKGCLSHCIPSRRPKRSSSLSMMSTQMECSTESTVGEGVVPGVDMT